MPRNDDLTGLIVIVADPQFQCTRADDIALTAKSNSRRHLRKVGGEESRGKGAALVSDKG